MAIVGGELAIEIGRRRIRALVATRERGRIRARRSLVALVPDDVDADDPKAFGTWLGRCLAEAKFPRGRTTIALSRDMVALKRLHLPTADDDELAEMTRLALQRELPFDANKAVIDFVPVVRDEKNTTVLAAAVPENVRKRMRETVKAAGLSIERITLRSMGSATLLHTLGRKNEAGVLAIDMTETDVEFCVMDGGTIRFSRAAEISQRLQGQDTAEAVLTETRRTWLSYRIVEGAADITHAVLMGNRDVAERAGARISQMLSPNVDEETLEMLGGSPPNVTVLKSHPLVDARAVDLDHVWPLAGVLLEPAVGLEMIDFTHPRRAPDVTGQRRRRMIMAAGLAVILVLGAWTFARRDLQQMQREQMNLTRAQLDLRPEADRYARDTFTLAHLKRWEEADANWLEHVLYLQEMMPPPGSVVLDTWTGTLEFRGVEYDRRDKEWSVPKELRIVLDGEAKDRRTADSLRASLVSADAYIASSSGADSEGGRRLPYGFTYRLRTFQSQPAPMQASEDDAETTEQVAASPRIRETSSPP
jgi:hypothetical protein